MVAVPPEVYTTRPVSDVSNVKINQCIIGTCAGGTLEDLRVAAGILEGRHIAPGVRFIVSPVTQRVYAQASREGLLATLTEAGAHVNADTAMGWYLGMDGLPKEEIAAKFMSGVDPDIAANVSAGDMLVCDRDFGYGKVHASIFTAMEMLQVSCIIAESFATQMVQTGLMFGAVLVEVPGITDKVSMGDGLEG